MNIVPVGDIRFGGKLPVIIAGPCVLEDETSTLAIAERLVDICAEVGLPLIFKGSYDKANRTSVAAYRGPGLKKGLRILKKVKETFNIPVVSDVHEADQVEEAAEVLDILQIPAFLCRQTDLILKAAGTGKAVNIKKGQFLAPTDVGNIINKAISTGNKNIMITERGTSFGYNNLVVDFRSLPIMRDYGYPVIFDATHSVQRPGGGGDKTLGDSQFVPSLIRAAMAVGCDGLFIETHLDPSKSPSDGANMVRLDDLAAVLKQAKEINQLVKG